jgi:long-chain acyl-CoA synthetase
VRIDEAGQILVKGDNVMLGYLDDEEATAAAFDDGWYKTGDLGYLDSDGFLYVTGRCKDLIVLRNGKNVMPEEIEELLCKSPLIAEAMVKEVQDDILMAIIYPDPEASKDKDAGTLHDAVQHEIDKTNQKLIYYKKVRKFVLRDKELPKTSTKKIIRYKVAEEYLSDVRKSKGNN